MNKKSQNLRRQMSLNLGVTKLPNLDRTPVRKIGITIALGLNILAFSLLSLAPLKSTHADANAKLNGAQSEKSSGVLAQPIDSGVHTAVDVIQWFNGRVDSKLFISDGEVDVDHSHFGGRIGWNFRIDEKGVAGKRLKRLSEDKNVRSLFEGAKDLRYLLLLDFQFSFAPFLVGARVEDQLNEEAKLRIADALNDRVEGEVRATPGFMALPPSAQNQLITSSQSQARVAFASQLREARAQAKNQISDRLDDLHLESVFQTIALGVGIDINETNIVVIRAGKMEINHGARVDQNNQTFLDDLRPRRTRAQRAGGVANTTAAQVRWLYAPTDDSGAGGFPIEMPAGMEPEQIVADLYVFHNRRPWHSAREYIAGRLTQSDRQYKKERDLTRLDSVLARLLYVSEQLELNVYAGNYDGDWAGGAGVKLSLAQVSEYLDGANVIIDYHHGTRPEIRSALSIFLHYGLDSIAELYGYGEYVNGWTLVAGFEHLDDSIEPLSGSDEPEDYQQSIVGLDWLAKEGTFEVPILGSDAGEHVFTYKLRANAEAVIPHGDGRNERSIYGIFGLGFEIRF